MRYACVTHALLVRYSCFTRALLVLYSCFTPALLVLYASLPEVPDNNNALEIGLHSSSELPGLGAAYAQVAHLKHEGKARAT
jgi:hypothetical protein